MAKAAKKPTTKRKAHQHFKDPKMAAFHTEMKDLAPLFRKAKVASTPKKPKNQE